jgi:hypothetical protein
VHERQAGKQRALALCTRADSIGEGPGAQVDILERQCLDRVSAMGLKPRVKWASGHCLRAQLETRETGAIDREEKSIGPKPKTSNTESGFRMETATQRKPKSHGLALGGNRLPHMNKISQEKSRGKTEP